MSMGYGLEVARYSSFMFLNISAKFCGLLQNFSFIKTTRKSNSYVLKENQYEAEWDIAGVLHILKSKCVLKYIRKGRLPFKVSSFCHCFAFADRFMDGKSFTVILGHLTYISCAEESREHFSPIKIVAEGFIL